MTECCLMDEAGNPMINPFSEDYLKSEIEWYKPENYDINGLTVKSKQISGRCDDFFNKNFRIKEEGSPYCPILSLDGRIQMSLTFMEVQSMYLPIFLAEGYVATSGSGMGYFPMRVAENDSVYSVDIYEIDQRVIDYFNHHFSKREGFNKINIIKGDVRETLKGKEYDFMFADHYPDMLYDVVIPDFELITTNNKIGHYYFWGQERIILQYRMDGYTDVSLEWYESELFRQWFESEDHDMYNPVEGHEFVEDALTLMKRI